MANKKKKRKIKVAIPEHDDEALKLLNEWGIGICDYAKFEGNRIIGFQRWGRGWHRYTIEPLEE